MKVYFLLIKMAIKGRFMGFPEPTPLVVFQKEKPVVLYDAEYVCDVIIEVPAYGGAKCLYLNHSIYMCIYLFIVAFTIYLYS